jgi:hypothetical protein
MDNVVCECGSCLNNKISDLKKQLRCAEDVVWLAARFDNIEDGGPSALSIANMAKGYFNNFPDSVRE